MAALRYVPLIIGIILAVALIATAYLTVPASVSSSGTSIKVGYPDSLDESDVSDLYAYANILPSQGIYVTPTFYDAPFLSYKALVSSQVDIALVSGNSFFGGVAAGQATTLVGCYSLGGTFLMVAGHGIANPNELKGGAVDDFGPGSETRALNIYWLNQSGVPTNAAGLSKTSVYLRPSGPNPARINDLEKGTGNVSAITIDDFALQGLEGSQNTTANGGPFHVLFNSPMNVVETCYAVRDSWLKTTSNQQVLIKFLAGIYKAQRLFIDNPSFALSYSESQLPLTNPSEINFTDTFYPETFTYWPYGGYNLIGAESAQAVLNASNNFYQVTGIISSPLSNSSVSPFGMINGYFESQALSSLGKFIWPCQPYVNAAFAQKVSSIVPSSLGAVNSTCS
jgi:hypothetical protein